MSDTKFELGEHVTYARPTVITPPGRYAVVRVFPTEGAERRYGIKRADEPYERVVSECDLAYGGQRRRRPARART